MEEESRYAVATTLMNMGDAPLLVRQGDIIAYASEVSTKLSARESKKKKVPKHCHLAKQPTATGEVDGLSAADPHYGKSGTQSVAKIKDADPKFKKWCR